MFTEAFPNLYKNNSSTHPPSTSNLKLNDDYGNEVLKTITWTKSNFQENHRCIQELGPKNIIHRTGFRGMLPFFHSASMMHGGGMPIEPADFEQNSGGLFRHSEGLFSRLQSMFEGAKGMHPEGDNPHFHHKEHHENSHVHEEIKKLKKDHETDKIA